MNWTPLLAAAKRAQAAYLPDECDARTAFESMGLTFVGRHCDLVHRAVLSCDAEGATYLSISGTRFNEANNIDLLDDLYLLPIHAPRGGIVASGAHSGMAELWQWVMSAVPPNTIINIEGHSLGGERALLTPLFVPSAQIGALYVFDAPKCASQSYWDAYRSELAGAVCTVHGRDVWYGWPLGDLYCHDAQGEVLWLADGMYRKVDPAMWPGGLSVEDHRIDAIVETIERLATQASIPV